MKNMTFDEIEVGASATFSHTVTQPSIELLALVSGDVDPFYILSAGPESLRNSNTVEGAAAAALIAIALGAKLPGPGMHIRKQSLSFEGAVSTGDTLTATVVVTQKKEENSEILLDCRCTNQGGFELAKGNVVVTAPRLSISYDDIIPPQITVRRSDAFIKFLKACDNIAPVSCAIAHPCDRDSLLGPVEAAKRGIIQPVLVGPEDRIREVAAAEGIDIGPYRIVPAPHSHAAAQKAVELARAGEVDSLMKGSLHTDEFMGAVVKSETGLRTARRLSHVFVMDVPAYPRPIFITDAAINISPTMEDKAAIIQNAIDLAHILGVERPRVAILSAVETINSKIASTLDAAALCKMADRGQITGAILDGPLAFDNAVSLAAAKTKGIVSPVAGQADILLAPNLEAGNMLAKQLSYLAGAESAGIVLGARVPIVLTSRADSVRARLVSTALMALVAGASGNQTIRTR
ncbi:MAG: bifunctional enoyl-CoA hydratase/phosphate acetyltransferase [Syntrophobacteraceae bacterium]|nr:bifunctional enoyl-CoA hydratase/phosphate acetyltransferase [Syntrophobacteraceae bacterium]